MATSQRVVANVPLSVAAILTFHDAVELWLYLASEFLDADLGKRQDLMQYWEVLGQKLDRPLPGKQGMKRLNEARVTLKHYGVMPSTAEVRGFREATGSFLQEATSLVFRLSFTEVSAIDLVADPLHQKVYALLRCHLLQMKAEREDDSRRAMHSPEEHADSVLR